MKKQASKKDLTTPKKIEKIDKQDLKQIKGGWVIFAESIGT